MSERRFVIREIYEGEDPESIHWTTESELKRRLRAIWENCDGEGDNDILKRDIDILLNGEGEKGEDIEEISRKEVIKISRQILARAEEERKPSPTPSRKEWEELPNYDTPCYICKKAANLHEPWCSRGKLSPTPTREEWEAWAEATETAIITRNLIKEYLMAMPIVPK